MVGGFIAAGFADDLYTFSNQSRLMEKVMEAKSSFIEVLKDKTKQLSIQVIRLYGQLSRTDEGRIMGRQLLRSASSAVANYRATCRARSKAEFYAKLSIVIEEMDETLFWLELLEESGIHKSTSLKTIKDEAEILVRILSKARKTASTNK
jgi:four helix bundle protein